MLNPVNPMILKIKIVLAVVAAIFIGALMLQISNLKNQNATLTARIITYSNTIQVYSDAMEAQSQQNSEDLTKYKFDRELQNDINKVKGTDKDTAIDPELVNVINKLQRSREQALHSDPK